MKLRAETLHYFMYVMALFYIAAGINHFVHLAWYLKIIPDFLPLHEALNYVSGAAEIVLGILLIPVRTRQVSAWGIILLLIFVFPANINMCYQAFKNNSPETWLLAVRLPMQFLFIWWAWLYTKCKPVAQAT